MDSNHKWNLCSWAVVCPNFRANRIYKSNQTPPSLIPQYQKRKALLPAVICYTRKPLLKLRRFFQAIQGISIEMHAKRGYKIYICSVILGKLESFRNYEGFSIIFPKILDEISRITKERISLIRFLFPSIFESKNFKFFFL